MNTQTHKGVGQVAELHLAAGKAAAVGRGRGELTVLSGRVWLTRHDVLGDHVLERGERVNIALADRAVVESWDRDQAAVVQWRAIEWRAPDQALAAGLRGLAFLAGGVAFLLARAEAGFAALARSAASSARRAQGCISVGDSIASSGAVK